jgi:hypothetical protein
MTFEVAGIDPTNYTISGFKRAVYSEKGTGTWLDDMKLSVVWYLKNDKRDDIPEHLSCLLESGPEIEEVID